MTTRSTVTRLISAIPVDTLRPHANFGATLTSRIDSFTQADVAALQNLTSNRYKQQVMTTRGDYTQGSSVADLKILVCAERQVDEAGLQSRILHETECCHVGRPEA